MIASLNSGRAGESQPEPHWYVLRVKPRHEKTVAAALRNKGLEDFLPLYAVRNKWADRYKVVQVPLFPGYVFCRFDARKLLPVLVTPGVVQVVGYGNMPAPVEPEEIRSLGILASSALSYGPFPYLREGQRVLVNEGPLRGAEGLLVQVKSQVKVVISVTLLQRSVAVELDRDWVTPCEAPRLSQEAILAQAFAKPSLV